MSSCTLFIKYKPVTEVYLRLLSSRKWQTPRKPICDGISEFQLRVVTIMLVRRIADFMFVYAISSPDYKEYIYLMI